MIEFTEIEGIPDKETFGEIVELSREIFGKAEPEKFAARIDEAKNLLIILALNHRRIVGFKVGYETAPKVFYSWVGGVDKNYRKNGIAQELMKRQHDWCLKNGFDIIQTKTKNSFKAMLILNLKNGFDIIDVYSDINNELKILLEKDLAKS